MEPITPYEPGCNWAGNYHYKAKHLYRPRSVAEIQELVIRLDKVKALGSRHCFNDIADSPIALVSTERLDQMVIDENAMTVTLGGGLRYGQFCPALDRRGYALHNLASLPHISVAGAIATATHGSGVTNGNLGTAVSEIEFVSGTGDLITLNRWDNADLLSGAIVNLGALGVVTKITLEIEKTFSVRQDVFEGLAFAELTRNFDEIMSSGYSVSLFTKWQNQTIDQVWVKRRITDGMKDLPDELFGSKAATDHVKPVSGNSGENRTDQMGIPGPWHERLPHFKMGFTPSSGDELQSEYFVPKHNAVDAILALDKLHERIGPLLQVSEIRAIAADDQWLSPCYKQNCVAFHFTWKPEAEAVGKLLPVIEAELAPYKARPHWGKVFSTSSKILQSLYERLPDFIELVKTYDPKGRFRNGFINKYIFDGL